MQLSPVEGVKVLGWGRRGAFQAAHAWAAAAPPQAQAAAPHSASAESRDETVHLCNQHVIIPEAGKNTPGWRGSA